MLWIPWSARNDGGGDGNFRNPSFSFEKKNLDVQKQSRAFFIERLMDQVSPFSVNRGVRTRTLRDVERAGERPAHYPI